MTIQCIGITLYGDQCRHEIRRGKYCSAHKCCKNLYLDEESLIVSVKRRKYRKKDSCNDIASNILYFFYFLYFWPFEIIRLMLK
jgi:hypothetical protein